MENGVSQSPMKKMPTKLTAVSTRLLDVRAELVQKVWGDIPKLYNHAVLCSVGLPYRNPYGPRARLLLLHLCSEAVKRQSAVVEVDDSFTAFARTLGLATSGRNLRTLRDQVQRMSVVSMRLARHHGSYVDVFQGPIFSKLRAQMPDGAEQLQLWTSFVEFSPAFFESLLANAVPLRLEAIGALKHSARALDVYVWLAHRLWRINDTKPVRLKWTTLRFQFGRRDQHIESFKRAFRTALKQVLLVYPEARVDLVFGGLLLKRSPPPVPRKMSRRLLA